MRQPTVKQEKFAAAVLGGASDADAYRAAGYSLGLSPGALQVEAHRVRHSPKVSLMIEAGRAELAQVTQVSREQIASELAAVGFASLGDVATWGPEGLRVKDSGDLEPGALAAVSEVVEVQTEHGHSIRVKLHDKVGALVKLSALLGYDKPASREPDRVRVTRMTVHRTTVDGATEDVAMESLEIATPPPVE
jgi:phage terminase small subunit